MPRRLGVHKCERSRTTASGLPSGCPTLAQARASSRLRIRQAVPVVFVFAAMMTMPTAALAEDTRLFRLMGGIGGGAGGAEKGVSAGGQFGGRALLRLGRVAGDFGLREGLYANDTRSVGTLFFGARWTPDSPWSARVGLAHHHEVPDEILFEQLGASVLGTADGIRHRTGLEVGTGHHVNFDQICEPGRLGMQIETSVAWLPDESGPSVYGFVDLLFTLDVGPSLSR
jgi:hypothetical protein